MNKYNNTTKNCIYCSQTNFDKEHVIPDSLGSFKNALTLTDKVCEQCNNSFKKMEGRFSERSPETFFKLILNLPSKMQKRKDAPFYDNAYKQPPLKLEGKIPGYNYPLLGQIIRGKKDADLLDHIIIQDDTSKLKFQIPFNAKHHDSKYIKKCISDNHIEQPKLVSIFSKIENQHIFEKAVSFMLSKGEKLEWKNKLISLKNQNIESILSCKIPDDYFRVLAKIALNYCIKTRMYNGYETELSAIKNFIKNAGDENQFITRTNKQIFYELSKGFQLNQWGHAIAYSTVSRKVFVYLQFFVGPRSIPPVWSILVGNYPRYTFVNESKCHFYTYYTKRNQYDGEVVTKPAVSKSFFKLLGLK